MTKPDLYQQIYEIAQRVPENMWMFLSKSNTWGSVLLTFRKGTNLLPLFSVVGPLLYDLSRAALRNGSVKSSILSVPATWNTSTTDRTRMLRPRTRRYGCSEKLSICMRAPRGHKRAFTFTRWPQLSKLGSPAITRHRTSSSSSNQR